MSNLEERLRLANQAFQARDQDLSQELLDRAAGPGLGLESFNEMAPVQLQGMALETIVRRTGRPVLAVSRDEPKLDFKDAESEVWRARLTKAKSQIVHAVRAVGRIEVQNNPWLSWVGTGWLVESDIVVTNRHVAKEFARQGGSGFVFRTGGGGQPMSASIDFLEEFDREDSLSFRLQSVLHIESDEGPDMALLKVVPDSGNQLAPHIALREGALNPEAEVAVIGYPARDSRIPDLPLMLDIFGDVFDKKRLAPGQILTNTATSLTHDCSTLGGNSGSVVLDLESGHAVGLHFAGRFLEANFAVPAVVVRERLAKITAGSSFVPAVLPPAFKPTAKEEPPVTTQSPTPALPQMTFTIPLQVTISLGPIGNSVTATAATSGKPVTTAIAVSSATDDDEVFEIEGRVEDYRGRQGYQIDFLGAGIKVPLPEITRRRDETLTFSVSGRTESILRYTHYSVVMNKNRRQCFFSAVNINGKESKRTARPGWRSDPRIPANLQIAKECYGNPPKFSRGHMTRREDPAWGSRQEADLGNADSMHFTNAVPQMQSFNGSIWLDLENYALQNARQDDMRICVITGPVFSAKDPTLFGVKIPVLFWKVIAFIHDQTGKLSATGYSISQEEFLSETEFVFGAHKTHQRSLSWIEKTAGVSFGPLTATDRFGQTEESMDRPLGGLGDIQFL